VILGRYSHVGHSEGYSFKIFWTGGVLVRLIGDTFDPTGLHLPAITYVGNTWALPCSPISSYGGRAL
jgi:hypothetical protein